jgi:Retrotransposon gag protein
MENLKIVPDILDKEAVKFELAARKVDISELENLTEARELLRKHLNEEAAGKSKPPDPVTDQEIVMNELKFMSASAPNVRDACLRFAAVPNLDEDCRLRTYLALCYARLTRLTPDTAELEQFKLKLLAHFEQSFQIVSKAKQPEEQIGGAQDEDGQAPLDAKAKAMAKSRAELDRLMNQLDDPSVDTDFVLDPRQGFSFNAQEEKGVKFPPNTKFFVAVGYDDKTKTHFPIDSDEFPAQAAPHRPKLLHMHNWKIQFSGDNESKMTLSEFLEAVRWKQNECEMNDKELMRGAHNLFLGPALRWYKANSHKWGRFKDLQSALLANFRPADYDERLWDQLRLRTQAPEERLNLYVSEMQSLFALLENIPSEESRLKFIKARLNPFCLQNIKNLRSINSIDQLADEWIELEALKSRVDNYRAPSAPDNPIEPNLAPKAKPKQKDAAHLSEVAIPFAERARDNIRRPFKTDARQPNAAPTPTAAAPSASKPNPAFVSKPNETRFCWNCDKRGHIFRDCRSQKVNIFCWTCGTKGVTKFNCSENCRKPKNVAGAVPLGRTPKGKPATNAGGAAASGSATSAV